MLEHAQGRLMTASHLLATQYLDGLSCAYTTEMVKCKGPFNHWLRHPDGVPRLGEVEEVNGFVAASSSNASAFWHSLH